MTRANPRPGYGLFQLLVVIAVLALLLGILLSAVQSVRNAAARMQSSNNLKQIGIALHNYHDANNRLPAGVDDKQFSALAHLLPYLEQDNLFKTIDLTRDSDDKANATVRGTTVNTFVSPSDPVAAATRQGPTSYQLVAGSKSPLKDNDGLFYRDSKVTFAQVTDGTSNTLFAVETLRGDGGTKAADVARQHVRLKEADLVGIKDETGVKEFKAGKNVAGDRGAAWIDGRYLQATFSLTREFNDPRPDVDCGGAGGHAGPRSLNPRTNVAFADGSVRFLTDSVKLAVWQAVATRAGGEVVNLD